MANTDNGELVYATEANKGIAYHCPVCRRDMVLRKSGNQGKNAKRPHFAHKHLTTDCAPETALHYLFKTQLFQYLKESLSEERSIPFNWKCGYCSELHNGNLMKKVTNVKLEFSLGDCQPDIALLDNNQNVFAVIEVVVTHKPDKKALSYYKRHNIVVIQYILKSEQDLENLDNKLISPDTIDLCINPKCKKCGRYMHKLIMMVIEASCYRCGSEMKCATIYSPNGGAVRGGSNYCRPADFTDGEKALARSKGVVLKERFSKTVGYSYLANACGHCKAFVGDHYLFTNYIAPARYGDLKSETIEAGYDCQYCSASWIDKTN